MTGSGKFKLSFWALGGGGACHFLSTNHIYLSNHTSAPPGPVKRAQVTIDLSAFQSIVNIYIIRQMWFFLCILRRRIDYCFP